MQQQDVYDGWLCMVAGLPCFMLSLQSPPKLLWFDPLLKMGQKYIIVSKINHYSESTGKSYWEGQLKILFTIFQLPSVSKVLFRGRADSAVCLLVVQLCTFVRNGKTSNLPIYMVQKFENPYLQEKLLYWAIIYL